MQRLCKSTRSYCKLFPSGKDGHGLDSQEYRCREFAKSNGFEVERIFPDSITGGGDFLLRPAMRELLAYVDSKPHQQFVIIFDDLKRFARDTVFHWNLRSTLKVRNVVPKCLNYSFDDSPEGTFVETIFAAQNQLEREQNRRQVIQKQKARLESGYWPFYPPPGYRALKDPVHGKLLTPTDKASIIREAFEGFATNRFKDQIDVQRFLKENEFNNGKPIYVTFTTRLLSRIIYAGYIEYEPWEVSRRPGHHKAIIDLDIFEKVQNKLKGHARCFTRKDTNSDFPLRGPVICSLCRHSLTASWSKGRNKKHPYYRCNQIECPLKNRSIKKELIENRFGVLLSMAKAKDQVVDYTIALFLKEWKERKVNQGRITAKKEKALFAIVEEKTNLIQRISKASDIVAKEYEKRIEELSKQEALVSEQITNPAIKGLSFETALEAVLAYIKNPSDKWKNGTLNDKRLVLKLVFADKIPYDYENGFGTANYSLPIKAFELLATSESQLVEMGVLKPRPRSFPKSVYLGS